MRVWLLAIAVTAMGLSGAAGAARPERGRLLYENHCTACHTSVVHVRSDRSVDSLDALRHQVVRWSHELGLDWSRGELLDVMAYLDETYYHLAERH